MTFRNLDLLQEREPQFWNDVKMNANHDMTRETQKGKAKGKGKDKGKDKGKGKGKWEEREKGKGKEDKGWGWDERPGTTVWEWKPQTGWQVQTHVSRYQQEHQPDPPAQQQQPAAGSTDPPDVVDPYLKDSRYD